MEPVCTGRHVTCVKNKLMVYNVSKQVSGHSVWPLSCPCVRRLCFWGRFLLGRKSGGMPRHHCTTKCITQTLSVPHFQPIPRIYPRFTASLHSLASQPAFTSSLHSLASQPAFTACLHTCLLFQNLPALRAEFRIGMAPRHDIFVIAFWRAPWLPWPN